jgi:hypothetical protein
VPALGRVDARRSSPDILATGGPGLTGPFTVSSTHTSVHTLHVSPLHPPVQVFVHFFAASTADATAVIVVSAVNSATNRLDLVAIIAVPLTEVTPRRSP